MRPPSADLRRAVHDLWAVTQTTTVDECTRLYVEAAALGLFGSEPYATVVRESNAHWTKALVDHLVRSGVRRPLARRSVHVIDAAFMGFQLDLPLDTGDRARKRAITDLADAVAAIGR